MEQHQQKEQRKTTRNRGTPLPHLRELRRSAGMTQRELAELSGTSQSTVLLLETGRRAAYACSVRKLASALGVSTPVLVLGRRRDWEDIETK